MAEKAAPVEFRRSKDVERWLRDKPREWAVVMAHRAALRALPLALARAGSGLEQEQLTLAALRASIVVRTGTTYEADVLQAARAAAAAAARAASAASGSAAFAAFAATRAATNSAAFAAADAATSAAFVAARAAADASAAAAAAFAAAAAAAAARAAALAAAAFAADAVFLADRAPLGTAVQDLLGSPLWLEDVRGDPRFAANPPLRARQALDSFDQDSSAQAAGFGIWAAWYRALLPNGMGRQPTDFFGRELSMRIASQPNDWWDRPATEVNADIATWLAERDGGRTPPDADIVAAVPEQSPAAFRFRTRDGRIVAEPPEPHPRNLQTAQDLLDEVREKAAELHDRLARSNAPPRVARSVERLVADLPGDAKGLRVGLIASRYRSIEADASAYANDPAELLPDAVAQLNDTAECTRDLLACYPEYRDIERERVASGLVDPEKARAAKEHLDRIAAEAAEATEVFDDSAVRATDTMRQATEEDLPPGVREERIADYGLVVRNLVAAPAREVADTCIKMWAQTKGPIIDSGAKLMHGGFVTGAVLLLFSVLPPLVALSIIGVAGFDKIKGLTELVRKLARERGLNLADDPPVGPPST
jgi:hypothetical protein